MSTTRAAVKLESLPSELQTLIFNHIDDVQSLLSLTRASPRLLQVYLQACDAILIKVVHNQIPAELLPIAFSILEQEDNTGLENDALCLALSQHQITTLRTRPAPSISSANDAQELHRFHSLANRLSQGAADRALELLRNCYAPQFPSTRIPPLSSAEQFRISRGFYTFALMSPLCRRFMSPTCWRRGQQLGMLPEQTDPFRPRYYRWFCSFLRDLTCQEVEEIYFVVAFLGNRMLDFVESVEVDRSGRSVQTGSPGEGCRDDQRTGGDPYDVLFAEWPRLDQRDRAISAIFMEHLTLIDSLSTMSTPQERLDCFQTFCLRRTMGGTYLLNGIQARVESHVPDSAGLCDHIHVNRRADLGLAIWDRERLGDMGISQEILRHGHSADYDFLYRRKSVGVRDRARSPEDRRVAGSCLMNAAQDSESNSDWNSIYDSD